MIAVCFPRSGSHFLTNCLKTYFGNDLKYLEPYTKVGIGHYQENIRNEYIYDGPPINWYDDPPMIVYERSLANDGVGMCIDFGVNLGKENWKWKLAFKGNYEKVFSDKFRTKSWIDYSFGVIREF